MNDILINNGLLLFNCYIAYLGFNFGGGIIKNGLRIYKETKKGLLLVIFGLSGVAMGAYYTYISVLGVLFIIELS